MSFTNRVGPVLIAAAPLVLLIAFGAAWAWAWAWLRRRKNVHERVTPQRTVNAKTLRTVSGGAAAMLAVLGPMWLSSLPTTEDMGKLYGEAAGCAVKVIDEAWWGVGDCYDAIFAEEERSMKRTAAGSVFATAFLLALGTGFQSRRVDVLSERDEVQRAEEARQSTREAVREAVAAAIPSPRQRPDDHDVLAWVADAKRTAPGWRQRRAFARAQRAILTGIRD